MGRRSKLEEFTDAEKTTLLNYLRAGNFRSVACAAIGITSRTLKNWEERAATGDERFSEFMAEVERVEALAEIETVNVIAACRQGRRVGEKDRSGNPLPPFEVYPDWKAAAFLLERRGPRRWAPLQKNEHTGKDGTPLDTAAKVIILPPKNTEPDDDGDVSADPWLSTVSESRGLSTS